MTTRTFPLSGPINLIGRVGTDSFVVDARDDLTEATVTLTPTGDASVLERATVEMRGNVLVVALPRQGGIFDLFGGRKGRDTVDVEVIVPTGTPVKISSFTGDITLRGRVGNADLASGAAAIDADDIDGNLRLRMGSGNTDVRHVRGNVQSRAGSGSLRFGEVDGEFTSACGSGNVSVGTAHRSVRTRAGSGDASIGAVHGDVDFVSGSGNVTIGLPAGRSARLDVTTGSGRVESEMPVESEARSDAAPVTVRVRTGSGDIRLVRAA